MFRAICSFTLLALLILTAFLVAGGLDDTGNVLMSTEVFTPGEVSIFADGFESGDTSDWPAMTSE